MKGRKWYSPTYQEKLTQLMRSPRLSLAHVARGYSINSKGQQGKDGWCKGKQNFWSGEVTSKFQAWVRWQCPVLDQFIGEMGRLQTVLMLLIEGECWNAATNSKVNSTFHELVLNASYWCPMSHGEVRVTVETVTRVSYSIVSVPSWSPLFGVDTDMLPS